MANRTFVKLGLIGATILGSATQAYAQEMKPACELHVWSSDKIKAYVSGWNVALGGGLLGGLLDGKLPAEKAIGIILVKAMERPNQAELLKRLDLPTMLAMPAVDVKAEPPLPTATAWKGVSKRLSASASACYAELIVRDMYFQKTALFKPQMRVNFTYRYFGDKLDKPEVMEGRGGNDMTVYPLVSSQDLDQITNDFQRTYLLDFIEFINDQHKNNLIKGAMPAIPASLQPPADPITTAAGN